MRPSKPWMALLLIIGVVLAIAACERATELAQSS